MQKRHYSLTALSCEGKYSDSDVELKEDKSDDEEDKPLSTSP
jgi:hypothetical protein